MLAPSAYEDRGYLRELLSAGAVGYVLKRSAAESLRQAIRTVAAGGQYPDAALAPYLPLAPPAPAAPIAPARMA
ncbi:MAG TPA: hypothetical protein VD886_15735 [Herpetosiphonaceae bacterium]|nr:hypothetical protein [Herpetosiphonaceae bacterium]